jgi:2,4-dienoyl-CoA reductase-like NADH-dependent reductase (Old Yellow Enzyme family)
VPLEEFVTTQPKALAPVVRLFLKRIMPRYPYEEAFFLEQARQFRKELSMPLMLLGGITRLETVQQGLDEGFAFAVMGRALLREPDLISRWQQDADHRSPCSHCNRCAPTIYSRAGTTCVERPTG